MFFSVHLVDKEFDSGTMPSLKKPQCGMLGEYMAQWREMLGDLCLCVRSSVVRVQCEGIAVVGALISDWLGQRHYYHFKR